MSSEISDSPLMKSGGNGESIWKSSGNAWSRFWFTPADPTLLGLLRICTGIMAVYTLIAYTWDLQAFFGKDAWLNHELREKTIEESPFLLPGLTWPKPMHYPTQLTEEQKAYIKHYLEKWKEVPPLPFPENQAEANAIDRYRAFWNVDPRVVYSKGTPEWSLWYHITEPEAMMTVHVLFLIIAVLFTVGFATRITSVLVWFAGLCYVHRAPISLFGFDAMMNIMLLYLAIGPSGAALSVDKWIRDWWRKRRTAPGKGDQAGRTKDAARAVAAESAERNTGANRSVTANLAIRLLQVHVCIIYASAGLAKLQGAAWWDGTAIWRTIANSEFAPMQSEAYFFMMQQLSGNLFLLQTLLATGTYFTLFFEIAYPFLIWSKRFRWVMLGMAAMLHGVIGLFMGLKTFAFIMLVMNAAFLPPTTVQWIVGLFRWPFSRDTQKDGPAGESNAVQQSPAAATAGESATGIATKVKRKG